MVLVGNLSLLTVVFHMSKSSIHVFNPTSPLIGTLAAAILSYVWMYVLDSPDVSLVSNYPLGVVCFALSAVLEMTTEPLFIIGQKLLYVRLKVWICVFILTFIMNHIIGKFHWMFTIFRP